MEDQELIAKFRSLLQDMNKMEIHDSTSDQLLLCFLRARKNDINRAYRLLRNYLKMLTEYPDLLADLTLRDMKWVLDMGHHLVSPRRDERSGCKVFIFKASHWDFERCSLEDLFRCTVCCFQKFVSDDETQRRGIVAVVDFKDYPLRLIRQIYPSILKKLAELLNDVFPIRFYGIHIVFEPLIFRVVIAMIWPFLSAKIRSRIYFHGNCMTSLHDQVDPSCLPNDYDGCLGPADEMSLLQYYSDKDFKTIFENFII